MAQGTLVFLDSLATARANAGRASFVSGTTVRSGTRAPGEEAAATAAAKAIMIVGDLLNARVPVGFFAMLLPWSKSFAQRLAAYLHDSGDYNVLPACYDMNLVLFGQGFIQCHYNFAVDNALYPNWRSQCIC